MGKQADDSPSSLIVWTTISFSLQKAFFMFSLETPFHWHLFTQLLRHQHQAWKVVPIVWIWRISLAPAPPLCDIFYSSKGTRSFLFEFEKKREKNPFWILQFSLGSLSFLLLQRIKVDHDDISLSFLLKVSNSFVVITSIPSSHHSDRVVCGVIEREDGSVKKYFPDGDRDRRHRILLWIHIFNKSRRKENS